MTTNKQLREADKELDRYLSVGIAQAEEERDRYKAECERLRSIISDLKDWDCEVGAGFLSIPWHLRRRMQEAIDAAMQEVGS